MRTRPPDLSDERLSDALESAWSFVAHSIEYLPVGFGAHHWLATDAAGERRFVTVDVLEHSHLGLDPESAYEGLERALHTARALHDDERLDFVVAPLWTRAGGVTHRLDRGHAVSLFPYLDGDSPGYGEYTEDDERTGLREAVEVMLGRLHSAERMATSGLPRREQFEIPGRAALIAALDELDAPWRAGPYAEPLRQLLIESRIDIRASLRAFDTGAERARRSAERWVVTHGEPHRSNVIRTAAGGAALVDWDTVRVGPRERDLWMVTRPGGRELERYAASAGRGFRGVDEGLLQLYRDWWVLADVASFVGVFRRPHGRTSDTETAWRALTGYLLPDGR